MKEGDTVELRTTHKKGLRFYPAGIEGRIIACRGNGVHAVELHGDHTCDRFIEVPEAKLRFISPG